MNKRPDASLQEDARQIMEQLTVIQKRLMYSTQKFECHDGSGRGAWEAENPLTDESPAPSPVVSIRDSSMLFVDSNKVGSSYY